MSDSPQREPPEGARIEPDDPSVPGDDAFDLPEGDAFELPEREEFTAEPPPEPPPAADEVEHLLTTLGKALRAFNMYESNNPVFQRFESSLREAFEAVWEEIDELTVNVTEEGFRYGDRLHVVGQGRDNLAFAFYKDGVRTLTFLAGFEEEVDAFLAAVARARRAEDDADDLITILWEEELPSFKYGYVDLLMEGLALPDQPLKEAGPMGPSFLDELGEDEGELSEEGTRVASGPALEGVSRSDFDETLYFLDRAEMATLEREVEIEMDRNLREDVLNALFDRLEEPGPDRQEEILDILDQLLPLFLSRGDLKNAASILEELDRLQGDDERLGPPLRDRIERLFVRLSDPEVLGQFVQAVEDGAVSPESEEVTLFFSRLHAPALPVLIRYAETTESEEVRARLEAALDGLAERYPDALAELLSVDEAAVVAGAARVAGRAGQGKVVPALEKALDHPDRDVRLAVVNALAAIRLTPALQALTRAVEDEDREVRIAAATALGEVRFASARPMLEAVIEGKRIRDADLTEKMAFFQAYGAAGGNTAVKRLDEVLNSKGFLGRRNPTELRACAALGLGQSGTDAARDALDRAKADDDPVVRNAVIRALKEEMVSR